MPLAFMKLPTAQQSVVAVQVTANRKLFWLVLVLGAVVTLDHDVPFHFSINVCETLVLLVK